jgi:hypothetical protein
MLMLSRRAAPGRFLRVPRRLTLSDALYGLLAFAASGATITCALLAWLADRELDGFVFTVGGACLAAWAVVRLSGPPVR